MLIEFRKAPVLVDKKELISDFRLNLAPHRQLRAKFNYCEHDKNGNKVEVPIDLVVFRYSEVKLEAFSGVYITIEGKEMIRNFTFSLKVSVDLFKKGIRVRGMCNDRSVDERINHFAEILFVIKKMFLK